MHIKLLCIYSVLENISFIKSITFNNIVRFTCNSCAKPETCCMGTLIQPNIVLTTSFCANFCQINKGVHIIPIIKVYEYPYHRKFFNLQNEKLGQFSNITLALLEHKMSNKSVVLSAMGSLSTVGLKVLIPALTEKSLRLKSTVIQRCENAYTQSSGFHVCTSKTISDLKTCQQIQGAPLLLGDRVIGMSILHDCRLMQNIFIAVGPTLHWIRSIVEEMVQKPQLSLVLRNAETNSIEFSTLSKTRCTRSRNSTDTVPATETMKEINKTADTPATLPTAETATKLKEYVTSLESAIISVSEVPSHIGIQTTIIKSTSLPSTGMSSVSRDHTEDTQSNNSMPDAMNWFRLERSRLEHKPPSYLVLTSTRSLTSLATEFVDLT